MKIAILISIFLNIVLIQHIFEKGNRPTSPSRGEGILQIGRATVDTKVSKSKMTVSIRFQGEPSRKVFLSINDYDGGQLVFNSTSGEGTILITDRDLDGLPDSKVIATRQRRELYEREDIEWKLVVQEER